MDLDPKFPEKLDPNLDPKKIISEPQHCQRPLYLWYRTTPLFAKDEVRHGTGTCEVVSNYLVRIKILKVMRTDVDPVRE